MTLDSKMVGRPVGEVTENARAGTEEQPYAHCWQVADFLRMDCDELQRIVREYRGSARFRCKNFIQGHPCHYVRCRARAYCSRNSAWR